MANPEGEKPSFKLHVQSMSGEEVTLELHQDATVNDLREAIRSKMDAGGSGFRLISGSRCLEAPSEKLTSLEVEDGSTIIMMKERSCDYTCLGEAQKAVVKCGQYPNGLVYHGDRLLVATYFGILEVYSSELKLIHKEKLDVQGHPSQICMAGGSLVVASRDRGGVVIFEPVDGFPFGRGSRDRWARGVPGARGALGRGSAGMGWNTAEHVHSKDITVTMKQENCRAQARLKCSCSFELRPKNTPGWLLQWGLQRQNMMIYDDI
ncbi:unnamed protein product [Durusdinium trenchii]|uniref:Ubiquitin-like domain-containing protein n=1 Tax=Durusdinium trenchii TaxID=1381693 RepID=A0ABP0SV08_9DINO